MPNGAELKRKPPAGEGGGRHGDIPVERFIDVAEDIEPGWAKTLRERLESDREATTKAIRQNGHRLVGLVMLKERNPGLYDMKVKELQAQIEARKVARQYHEAKDNNRDDDCGRAMERMREVCERIINLQLWQRANELNSLEIFVKEQRESLRRDATPEGQRSLTEDLMRSMTATRPALGLLDVIERGGERGAPKLGGPKRGPDNAPPMPPGGIATQLPHDPPPPPPGEPAGPPSERGRPGDGGAPSPSPSKWEAAVGRLIEVAKDISPAAGDRLANDFAQDRDGTLKTIRQAGPRFFGLVVLKERDRDLYDMKVKELRLHVDLRTAANSYHEATETKRNDVVASATRRMQEITGEIVKLQLDQRQREVASLDKLLDGERAELAHDSQPEQTRARRDRLVTELMDAPPRPGLADLLDRESRGVEGQPQPTPDRPFLPATTDEVR